MIYMYLFYVIPIIATMIGIAGFYSYYIFIISLYNGL